ncbi:hypothetical protein ABI59_10100 [Acidobacteria bacterium Mor1]|nr:hypothetical protein ABI59_10100 [Acidobacteria bacterium Mor1]
MRQTQRFVVLPALLLLIAAGFLPGGGGASLLAAAEEEQVWPRWRGAASDGTAQSGDVFPERFGLRLRWKRELGSGYSAIAVAEGHAVTLFSDGVLDYVGALDAHTGEERWRTTIGPTFPGREGAVDGGCSTPAIDGGRVYALGPRGDLMALSLQDGSIVWRVNLADELGAPVPHWGFTSSPLVTAGRVIVVSGGDDQRIVTAFDSNSGKEVWAAGRDETGVNYQSAALLELDGRSQVVAASDTWLLGLDAQSGSVLWERAHGGQGFYARIVNPVQVDRNTLFFNHRPTEGTLLRLDEEEAAWTTPHLNRNYATPLHRDGTVFGYAGHILTAVDARDGSLRWQSRRPGNGWPILADGHLLVLTKEGTLHVAPASPDGWVESASIQMLERLVWTPPSFAYGMVYGRDSFGEIAAVEVVAGGSDAVAQTASPGAADSRFQRWLAELEQAENRGAAADRFLEENPQTPIIEGNHAHIVYVGEEEDVAARADMLLVREERPLTRVDLGDGRGLFHTSFELHPEARVSYQLVRDYARPGPDPRNPDKGRSFAMFGEVSRILMPEAPPVPPTSLPEGARIESFTLETEPLRVGGQQWGGEREIRVYLPPGYDDSERRYEAIYVHYGRSLAELTDFENGLGDRIGVLMQVTSSYEYARTQRGVHGRMVATQLVPEIDRRYRTIREPQGRIIAGADEGAYSSMEIGLRYPHLFGTVISQSLKAIGKGDRQLLDTVELLPGLPLTVHLDWGIYDPVDPRNGADGAAFNRRLAATLEQNGYTVTSREWNDGLNADALSHRLHRILAEEVDD